MDSAAVERCFAPLLLLLLSLRMVVMGVVKVVVGKWRVEGEVPQREARVSGWVRM
jgi:hypothetical protein